VGFENATKIELEVREMNHHRRDRIIAVLIALTLLPVFIVGCGGEELTTATVIEVRRVVQLQTMQR